MKDDELAKYDLGVVDGMRESALIAEGWDNGARAAKEIRREANRYESIAHTQAACAIKTNALYRDDGAGCKCNMRTQLLGDGCMVCNPQLHAEHLAEAIEDLRAENDRLRAALQKIADHNASGTGGWKHWKTLAHEALHEPPSAAQQQGTDIYSGIY